MLLFKNKPYVFLLLIFFFSCNLNSYEVQFIHIEKQKYIMGDSQKDSRQSHEVLVYDFFIADYNVTVADWKKYLIDTGYDYQWESYYSIIDKWHSDRFKAPLEIDEYNDSWPMLAINWYEAILYCNWLSLKHGLIPVYRYDEKDYSYVSLTDSRFEVDFDLSANGYRLPTEAEWELAAQLNFSETTTLQYDQYNSPFTLRDNLPVFTLSIYGLEANVLDWCWDYYDYEYYYYSEYMNPVGPSVGNEDIDVYPSYEWEWIKDLVFSFKVVRGRSLLRRSDDYVFARYRQSDLDRTSAGIRLVRSSMDN